MCKRRILTLILTSALLFTGCGTENTSTKDATGTEEASVTESANETTDRTSLIESAKKIKDNPFIDYETGMAILPEDIATLTLDDREALTAAMTNEVVWGLKHLDAEILARYYPYMLQLSENGAVTLKVNIEAIRKDENMRMIWNNTVGTCAYYPEDGIFIYKDPAYVRQAWYDDVIRNGGDFFAEVNDADMTEIKEKYFDPAPYTIDTGGCPYLHVATGLDEENNIQFEFPASSAIAYIPDITIDDIMQGLVVGEIRQTDTYDIVLDTESAVWDMIHDKDLKGLLEISSPSESGSISESDYQANADKVDQLQKYWDDNCICLSWDDGIYLYKKDDPRRISSISEETREELSDKEFVKFRRTYGWTMFSYIAKDFSNAGYMLFSELLHDAVDDGLLTIAE